MSILSYLLGILPVVYRLSKPSTGTTACVEIIADLKFYDRLSFIMIDDRLIQILIKFHSQIRLIEMPNLSARYFNFLMIFESYLNKFEKNIYLKL